MTAAARSLCSTPVPPSMVADDFQPSDVSIVVPVKNNPAGAARLVQSLAELDGAPPLEVVLVDNDSDPPLEPPAGPAPCAVRLVPCRTPGAAAARNAGAAAARGRWLLFTDSDCILTRSSLAGFGPAMNGAVAYAGSVRAGGTVGALPDYYDAQKTLIPPPTRDRPAYLVTANALVWREAFERADGFDERFVSAGGEDIDLGLRLARIGALSYAPDARVLHDFDDGPLGFVRRFVRYGEGNQLLGALHGVDMAPRFFWPARRTPFHLTAAVGQVLAMRWGYYRAARAALGQRHRNA